MSQLEQRYASSWPHARATYERALESLPGGNTRTQVHVEPFPLYAERGSGARMVLTDGAEVDDFLLNYSAAALGHRHPAVTDAIHRGIDAGGPFGLSVPAEVQLAERMCERFTGVERVRFTNSGSEATLQAVRAARAFTERPRDRQGRGRLPRQPRPCGRRHHPLRRDAGRGASGRPAGWRRRWWRE